MRMLALWARVGKIVAILRQACGGVHVLEGEISLVGSFASWLRLFISIYHIYPFNPPSIYVFGGGGGLAHNWETARQGRHDSMSSDDSISSRTLYSKTIIATRLYTACGVQCFAAMSVAICSGAPSLLFHAHVSSLHLIRPALHAHVTC